MWGDINAQSAKTTYLWRDWLLDRDEDAVLVLAPAPPRSPGILNT